MRIKLVEDISTALELNIFYPFHSREDFEIALRFQLKNSKQFTGPQIDLLIKEIMQLVLSLGSIRAYQLVVDNYYRGIEVIDLIRQSLFLVEPDLIDVVLN